MIPVGVAAIALASSANAAVSKNNLNFKEKADTTQSKDELEGKDLSHETVVDELRYSIGSDEHLLLMKRSERGTLFAGHGSHGSHGSHSSHRSGY